MKVLILFGGVSTEHEVSCVSASNVCKNIDKEKFEYIKLGITKKGVWWVYNGSEDKMADGSWEFDTENLVPAIVSPCSAHHGIMVLNKPTKTYEIVHIDVAFPVLHGKNGEDGTMQGLLKLAGIPCVGCDTYASAVSMHKCAAKIIAETVGVKTTPFVRVRKCDRATASEKVKGLCYPLFVKPVNGGSSVGITKVKEPSSLEAALDTAFETDDIVIIEQGVVGKEIEVAVLGKDEVLASVCGEIVAGAEFYDYENKYKDDTAEYYIPARLDERTSEIVRKNAVEVYKALDCKGFSRVDFFVTENGEVLFNEINTIPGFTAISMYPKLMGECGIPYSELITRLIEAEADKV